MGTHIEYGSLRETLASQGLPKEAIDLIVRELRERDWLKYHNEDEPTDYAYEDNQDCSILDYQ